MNARWPVVALCTLGLLASCGGDAVQRSVPGDLVGSASARITTPAPGEDVAAAVTGATEFGLDLYRALAAGRSGNLALSPHSVAVALAMSYAGAAGTTETAFTETLHVTLGEAAFHRAMNDLDRAIASRGEGALGSDGQPFRLRLVNQIFAQRGFSIEAPFLDVLAQEYGAALRLLDFVSAPEPSRESINGWVEDQTEGRIEDLIPEGVISPLTRLVIVNAIYFNAAWSEPFEETDTSPRAFTGLDGTAASVPMMSRIVNRSRAAQLEGLEVVEILYDGGEVSMVLLVPDAGRFAAFEGGLTGSGLRTYLTALQEEPLRLVMPKFEMRTDASLKALLEQLGLAVAFGGDADFSEISTAGALHIGDVLHQSFVKVDEKGTEAAAATAAVLDVTAAPVEPRAVVVDRPFLFLIRDRATDAILFVGRVVAP